jgi:hypothetical protein
MCLGVTKDGYPRHPLYVPYTAGLVPLTGDHQDRRNSPSRVRYSVHNTYLICSDSGSVISVIPEIF